MRYLQKVQMMGIQTLQTKYSILIPTGGTDADADPYNEIQDLELAGNILIITKNPDATRIDLSPYLDDTDTNLTEAEVDAFVANNGYLTFEVDGSVTNEIQDLQVSNNVITITKNADATPIDIGAMITNSAGWETDAGNVIYLNGNVGVGTVTPEGRLSVRGVDETIDEPLFMVARKDGYPVFAVYEDGVYAFTDTVDTGKGVKGGFAVGGYSKTSKGLGEEYMRVTADSIRFYIDEAGTVKGVKGGFAVGGYQKTSKGFTGNEFLRISPDSVRIYIDNDPLAKGVKGGFAVGGYRNTSKAKGKEYLRVTTDSTRIYAEDTDAGLGISIQDENGFVEIDYNSFLISSEGVRKVWLLDSIGYPGWIATKGPGDSFNAVIGFVTGYPDFGSIAVLNNGSNFRAGMQVNSNGTGVLYGEGPNDYTNFVATYLYGYPNNGYASVNDQYGNWQARMYVNGSGQGVMDADIKNFRMPHPGKPGHDIVYSCVEGPEAAAYIRGTAELSNGTAEIIFPDHFQIVAGETGMTILITPLSADSKGLAVVEKSKNGFTVKELFNGSGTYSFDWEAKCIRKGYEDYQVIQESIDNQTEESKSINSGGIHNDFIAPGNI